jgi:hypothetical protein
LFELDRPDDAEQVLEDADAYAVKEPEVLAVTMARTYSLFWSLGRTAEALEINERARARAPPAPTWARAHLCDLYCSVT